ncbi:MAG TPA: phosphoserine phosphatase SerB [Rhizomicrobium sp.]|nr:phosphoserine phosphatase SerB [Rhizomicrobium sp.]
MPHGILNVIGEDADAAFPTTYLPNNDVPTLLKKGHAFEIGFDGDFAKVLGAARAFNVGRGFDINVVPAENRRKKLLIADMDSTIIGCECLDELAGMAGLKPQISAITERAMRGEIGFEDALRARVAMLKGLPVSALARTYAECVRLNPGAKELVATMKAHGARALLVSGGFTYFTARVAAEAGFDAHQANTLLDDGAALTGEVAEPILGREAKLAALELAVAEMGIGYDDVLAVGDGATDLAMIARAGLGVAYHAKPIVAEAAAARIDHADLTALLHLQGYKDREVVR